MSGRDVSVPRRVPRRAAAPGLRLLRALALTAAAAGVAAPVARAAERKQDACIDENLRADLTAKRKLRGKRDPLVQQTNRHELVARGGAYISDTFDASYVAGGAYGYHMTEDFAVFASGAWTRIRSAGGPELERTFAVLGGKSRRELLFDATLAFTPAHAKMRIGGSIVHFDLTLEGGGGVVDSALSSGLAGVAGIGFKFFLGQAVALRFDVRDHVFHQQLLARRLLVSDLTAMLGFSLFLPVGE